MSQNQNHTLNAPNQEKPSQGERASALFACCRMFANQIDEKAFAEQLATLTPTSHTENMQQLLQRISQVARLTGLQTVLTGPSTQPSVAANASLPAILELRDGRFVVVTESPSDSSTSLSLLAPLSDGTVRREEVPTQQLNHIWNGVRLTFERINTALICFSIVAREHKIELTQKRLIHEYGLSREEIAPPTLLRMAGDVGLKAKRLCLNWHDLTKINKAFPAIACLNNNCHLILVGLIPQPEDDEFRVACYDPLMPGGHIRLSATEFTEIWSGELYLFKRHYKLTDPTQPFSLRWFIPEILRQKRTFIDIAVAVLFINAIALVTPIFFQIVIDKVLVNQAFTTLHTLGIGMVGALTVNAGLDFLRDFLLLHATNKIDLRITGRTFRHLLHLPLDFFEHMPAGVLTQHMQQTAGIRDFLTGNIFLTMLEATSLFVFLPLLFLYSLPLTGLVLIFTALITAVIAGLIVPFKKRLNELYTAEGKRQAMLVETITGMATVKAMAIEPLLRRQWEDTAAQAIKMQFRVGKISITAKALTQFLERVMTVVLIWAGASFVFDATMTVGALIAFQMLAGRVASPLVRLVGLIHQYQEATLSVEKLGVVMNARPEWGSDRHGARPSLQGDIVLERVGFRYAPDLPEVLRDVSLTIASGSTLGIVGPSGSGKTTLTRLLQKLSVPSSGTIRINNCSLNEIDTAHLRRKMGVVLQENFLFNATVADNIRAGQAAATRQQIIQTAILAGADEFIVSLPQGYDTMLEEGAKNLSGGQRQRLAIARALLTAPEILIFDEATSALDPESEWIVRENLRQIAHNRTVLIVSHRLSMLQEADSIIVLERGAMVGHGTHDQLLEACPLYATLWQRQMKF